MRCWLLFSVINEKKGRTKEKKQCFDFLRKIRVPGSIHWSHQLGKGHVLFPVFISNLEFEFLVRVYLDIPLESCSPMDLMTHWLLDAHLFLVIGLSLFLFVWLCVWKKEGDGGGEPLKFWLSRSTWISDPKYGSNLWATRQCLMTRLTSRSFWYFNSGVYLDQIILSLVL